MTNDQLEMALDRILTAADCCEIPASHDYKTATVADWTVSFEGSRFTVKDPSGKACLVGEWKGMRTARMIVAHVRDGGV